MRSAKNWTEIGLFGCVERGRYRKEAREFGKSENGQAKRDGYDERVTGLQ